MFDRDRSRHAVVAVTIVAVHVAAIGALLTVGHRRAAVVAAEPVQVRFVSAPSTPKDWKPPEVKAIVPTVVATMPNVPLIDIPVGAPSETAISVQAKSVSQPPPPSDPGVPKLISSVEYLREPIPRYPPKSRKLKEQGLVVLRVLIDEKGTASSIDIETSSGFVRLDDAARDAVSRAAFRPYVEDGSPRRAFVLIPIEFSLARSSA